MRQNIRYALILICLTVLLMMGIASTAQNDAVPTLVPPTPVPYQPTSEADSILSESRIARLQSDGVVRVGVLYNEIPFGEYTIQGEVRGFDADLARLLAETWGIEVEFIQVTRENRFELLSDGTVDMLMAAVVHTRALDAQFDFSQIYRLGAQSIMVKAEPDTESGEVQISTVFNLGGQRVGYVIGTEGEIALSNWIAETQVQIQPQPYLTYDEMLSALFGNEVVAIAGRDTRLLRTAAPVLEAVELLNTPLQEEPFAIAIPRQDTHFRNLLNRTLQYLASDAEVGQQSSLEVLHSEYFPNDDFPFNALPVYANVGDEAPALAAFPTDVPIPSVYAAPNILANGVLRVVGNASTEGLLPSQAFVPTANQNLVREIASRWGVEVQFVAGDPLQAVRDGTADIAVGIEPTWDVPGVDFSQPYAQHGRRLLYPSDRDYAQLSSLMATSRVVATLDTEDDAEELVEAWGNRVGIFNFRFFTTSWDTAAENLLENNNALVLIGDSLSLLPIVQQNPDTLSIGPTWYDRQYLTFALPQNDVDFRRLVNYTLQEMLEDGSLNGITQPILVDGDTPPQIGIYPGSSEFLGINLAR